MTVMVVGAGIAGVACARELTAAGVAVRIVDRGHAIGGRMATKHLGSPRRAVDIGAAYFTVRDPGFAAIAAHWQAEGLARPWTDTLQAVDDGVWRDTTGPARWGAPGGLRGLVGALAQDLPVELGYTVRSVGPGPVVDGERFDAVVLAMPDPQAARLVDAASPATAETARPWDPVLAVTAGFGSRHWDRLRTAAFVNDHPDVALIADDGARRGDLAPVLVTHSTAELAERYDAEPEAAVRPVLDAVGGLLGFDGADALWTHVHRWRYARPRHSRDTPFHRGEDGICLAGDGWGSPKVETAWRSGAALGRDLLGLGPAG
ncbi:NAD/FAD-dependent oxidoreductase [Amycolatopsis antarctica]|uniref:NAD/FAD-dependent oxidoreductase n=1 Tax=Amycolatopsis antarctica TaxID=1854586 RepID=A0A263D073_9PSEU|nr:FAD-dependent oxidoreductase [Amycolatopsis antarctica]OZM71833.1 NAD/FAD-dependent oxidoreductase [Amycolatopsis antarctica]